MICPNCGAECAETHRFCYICGTALPEPAEPHMPAGDNPTETEFIQPAAENSPEPAEAQASPYVPYAADVPYVTPAPVAKEPEPEPKKGRLWPPVLMLAVMICAGLALFFLGSAEETPPASETPWFTVEDGALSFHEDLYTGSDELTVPEAVDGQKVTAIANNAFNGCDGIATVILPDTVTEIGDYAFSSCSSLRGIYIPETVTSIGVYAFSDCDALEAIYLPGSLETMGHGSLDSCDGLHYILYNGTYDQWSKLYYGYFSSNVELHTTDGIYYAQP